MLARSGGAGAGRGRKGMRVAAAAVFGASAWAGAALAEDARDPHGVAVVIGNRAYEERGVSDVAHAARDAQAFARYAREVLGFADENVLVLEDAKRREMLDALGDPKDPPEQRTSDLLYALDPRGRSDVVVFYSGHGAPGVKDRQGYLLPVDVRARDAQDDGYPIAALYDTLAARLGAARRKARSVRVFLDACFSGRTPGGPLFAGASPAYSAEALPEGVVEGMTVLSAGGPEEMAHWDEDARHGMFTRHLLDALYGGADENEDGKVTASEAWFYLEEFMSPAVWRRWRARQHAQLLPPLAPGPGRTTPARRCRRRPTGGGRRGRRSSSRPATRPLRRLLPRCRIRLRRRMRSISISRIGRPCRGASSRSWVRWGVQTGFSVIGRGRRCAVGRRTAGWSRRGI